jgi:hypothetical protein
MDEQDLTGEGGSLGTTVRIHAWEEQKPERLAVVLVKRNVAAEFDFITVICLVFRATKVS